MRLITILITALSISSCATPSLVDGCFTTQDPPQTLTLPPMGEATTLDYRNAAIVRTKELLISQKQYNSARKCVEVFQ